MKMAGDVDFNGSAFVSEDEIYITSVRRIRNKNFEMLAMCIRQSEDARYMPGVMMGLTDGGRSPACCRAVIIDATAHAIKKPPAIVSREWPVKQRDLFVNHLSRETKLAADREYGMLTDRNVLNGLFKEIVVRNIDMKY